MPLHWGISHLHNKNDFLKEKVPRGNGTLCRLVSIKMKDDAPPCQWKNYHGRKVWTVCAKDCEWMEVEHVIKTDSILVLEKRMEETTSPTRLQANVVRISTCYMDLYRHCVFPFAGRYVRTSTVKPTQENGSGNSDPGAFLKDIFSLKEESMLLHHV